MREIYKYDIFSRFLSMIIKFLYFSFPFFPLASLFCSFYSTTHPHCWFALPHKKHETIKLHTGDFHTWPSSQKKADHNSNSEVHKDHTTILHLNTKKLPFYCLERFDLVCFCLRSRVLSSLCLIANSLSSISVG